MSLVILGIGTAVPSRSIRQQDAAELAKTFCCQTDEQARQLVVLYRHARVDSRSSVLLEESNGSGPQQSFFPPANGENPMGPTTRQRMLRYAQEAAPLALAAAGKALAESRVTPRRIGQLITVSCTGFAAPGIDVALIKRLGLANTVGRTHIGFMGCHAALNGLRVASAMVKADPKVRVLLCAVELCSLHFYCGWDPEKVVANALFADGAAALVVGPESRPPTQRVDPSLWKVRATDSCIFPDSEEAIGWRIGDHGFEMTLSPRVPALIGAHLRPWAEEWLGQHGLTLRKIGSWAIHPGGPRILSSAAQALGISEEGTAASRQVLAEFGNMSSPTLLFILDSLRRSQAPRPCVALGFGPGLAVEAALLA